MAAAPTDADIQAVIAYVKQIVLGQVPDRLRESVSIDANVRQRSSGDGIVASIYCFVDGPHEAISQIVGHEATTLHAIEKLARNAAIRQRLHIYIEIPWREAAQHDSLSQARVPDRDARDPRR